MELPKDAGYTVERWIYYDDRGYVYGYYQHRTPRSS
jgi:hypothetical protein